MSGYHGAVFLTYQKQDGLTHNSIYSVYKDKQDRLWLGTEQGVTLREEDQFKQLLEDIHQKKMDEQKRILEKEFQNWKGSREQVDDILVMGFKI